MRSKQLDHNTTLTVRLTARGHVAAVSMRAIARELCPLFKSSRAEWLDVFLSDAAGKTYPVSIYRSDFGLIFSVEFLQDELRDGSPDTCTTLEAGWTDGRHLTLELNPQFTTYETTTEPYEQSAPELPAGMPGECAGYRIIAALPVKFSGIAGHAIAIGQHEVSTDSYATWEYSTSGKFYWGHYQLTGPEAFKDAARRARS